MIKRAHVQRLLQDRFKGPVSQEALSYIAKEVSDAALETFNQLVEAAIIEHERRNKMRIELHMPECKRLALDEIIRGRVLKV